MLLVMTVRAAVQEHWGLGGELRPLQDAPGSRTWQLGEHVVKVARDESAHFTARLTGVFEAPDLRARTADTHTGKSEIMPEVVAGLEITPHRASPAGWHRKSRPRTSAS